MRYRIEERAKRARPTHEFADRELAMAVFVGMVRQGPARYGNGTRLVLVDRDNHVGGGSDA